MKKVFLKINEDVNITNPAISQQYIAVKKQISDKKTKRDQLMKQVNQIDNEINILDKNLLALETKDNESKQKTTTTPENKQPQQTQQTTQPQQSTQQQNNQPQQNESIKYFSKSKRYESFINEVIDIIDLHHHDGESLIYDHEYIVKKCFNNNKSPKFTANTIINIDKNNLRKQPPKKIKQIKEELSYSNLVNDLEKEIKKLTDIKSFIENYDSPEEYKEEPIQNASDELTDTKKPFEKSEEEKIVDETLKAEPKEQFVPNLIEQEDLENELDMLNYEEDDEPTDNYVFYVKIEPDTDEEIIAKVYKENPDDQWTLRVVKGDEEPLQSMEFDGRLDKLEILSYLADMYDDVIIMDKDEYRYLLNDKDKTDEEFYKDDEDEELIEESEKYSQENLKKGVINTILDRQGTKLDERIDKSYTYTKEELNTYNIAKLLNIRRQICEPVPYKIKEK